MTGWDRKTLNNNHETLNIDWTATKTATKYLPKGTDWYDFWMGNRLKGGREVALQTSLNRVPMFVRAGSIIPLAPEMQYVGEKSWDNLELRVYPGADGSFTLYEDEGDNYNYEDGYYATITFTWNDKARSLTIGTRQGGYKGMILNRKFTIVLPDGKKKVVEYGANEMTVSL